MRTRLVFATSPQPISLRACTATRSRLPDTSLRTVACRASGPTVTVRPPAVRRYAVTGRPFPSAGVQVRVTRPLPGVTFTMPRAGGTVAGTTVVATGSEEPSAPTVRTV